MEEKDQKSLTVGDILDQLVKPSIIKGPSSQVSQARPPQIPSFQPPLGKKTDGDIELPQLGNKVSDELSPTSDQSDKDLKQTVQPKRPLELKLSIRTMASDLAKAKDSSIAEENDFQKTVISEQEISSNTDKNPQSEAISDSSLPEKDLIFSPSSTPVPVPETPASSGFKFPFWTNKSPTSTPPDRPAHIHEEFQVSDKDNLPPFPGAPVPKKKVPRPEEEKVEYGVIAKVVSSGITTGVITTVVVAVAIYFLLTLFVFNEDNTDFTTPIPTPIEGSPSLQINELKTIFNSTPVGTLTLPPGSVEAMSTFKDYLANEILPGQEFKRIDLIIYGPQENSSPTLLDILGGLNINYPTELNNYIKESNLVLVYGQEEIIDESNFEKSSNRLVFIAEINNVSKVIEIMKMWEGTIANELANLFDLNVSRQGSSTFLDNERRGVNIRYKNYPLPDKSIDYSIVSSLTGRNYLIITNSRESMYSPADKIRGL